MSSKEVEVTGSREVGNGSSWTPMSNFGFARTNQSLSPMHPGKAPGDQRHETRDTNHRGSRRVEDAGLPDKLRAEPNDDPQILCDREITPKHTNRSSPVTTSKRAGSSARRNRGDLENSLPSQPSSDLKRRIDDEARENGEFAAEAGLSFDSDNGDKINDLALYNSSLSRSFDGEVPSGIWDRLVTISMSMSSINEHRRQSKHHRRTSSLTIEEDSVLIEADGDRGTIRSCSAGPLQSYSTESSFEYTYPRYHQADEKVQDEVTNGDGDSPVANNAVALRNETSKGISPCTKMIRGYADVQNRKTLPTKETPHSPKVPTKPEVDEHEMERILHGIASMLSTDWRAHDYVAPVLARRIRDFQFAREKRKKKYGGTHNIGILGIYDHLSRVKVDVQWAEDAAWRRSEGKPYLTWADFESKKKERRRRPYFTFIIVAIW